MPNVPSLEAMMPVIKGLAVSIRRGLPPAFELDDLVSAGVLAYYKAVERYDGRDGNSFFTYARHVIRGAIMDSVRADYRHSHRHAQVTEDVAEAPETEARLHASIDARRKVAVLPRVEREVLEAKYFGGAKVVEIAAARKVSKQRVSFAERSGLTRLRAA